MVAQQQAGASWYFMSVMCMLTLRDRLVQCCRAPHTAALGSRYRQPCHACTTVLRMGSKSSGIHLGHRGLIVLYALVSLDVQSIACCLVSAALCPLSNELG